MSVCNPSLVARTPGDLRVLAITVSSRDKGTAMPYPYGIHSHSLTRLTPNRGGQKRELIICPELVWKLTWQDH
ncbi:hypothetical protein [Coleofasciculus sp.]|uniref:hypothetical protein n=1 Tax=Coleofasciculus sp. TaxID=3100458 RepID=UPI003A34270E